MKRLFVLFFMVAGFVSSGWCAFSVGLNKGRLPINAVGIASINSQGIVFSTAPGEIDPIRYKWVGFSKEGLMELQRVLPRERAFQQKSGADKVGYLELISDELSKIQPQNPILPKSILPRSKPKPVKVVQVAPAVVTPTNPAPKIKKPPPAAPSTLPAKQPKSKRETEVTTVSAFQLIQPAGTTPSGDHRPPESGLSFASIFSPAGIFLVLMVMGFSVYAGNEIARFRNRPKSLVCAISALFPLVGPAIFLLLPDPAAKYADAMAEANDPFLIRRPGNPATTETEEPVQFSKVKHGKNLNTPYFNSSNDETRMESEPVAVSASKSEVMELYQASENQFDYEFFHQNFQRFVNSQPNDGQALTLRTHDLIYHVSYISQLSPSELSIIYPVGDELSEGTIEYGALEEVEVTVWKS